MKNIITYLSSVQSTLGGWKGKEVTTKEARRELKELCHEIQAN